MNLMTLKKAVLSKIAIAVTATALAGFTIAAEAQSSDEILAQVHIMVLGGEPGRVRRAIGYLTAEEQATLLDGPEYKDKSLRCIYDPNSKSGSCRVNGNHISALRYGSLSIVTVNEWMESAGGSCSEQRNGVPFGGDVGSRLQSSWICSINLKCNNRNCITQ